MLVSIVIVRQHISNVAYVAM